MFKITCYGVRPNELEFFKKYNKYGYELNLLDIYLNHENIETAKGSDALLLRANCIADKTNLQKMKDYGIKYVFTRTVGYNHIDIEAAKELGIKVARVPEYSPNSVAELALGLGISLLRSIPFTIDRTSNKNFIVDPIMFSREIRNSTVGIIGMGKIGYTEAKLYKGLGARVIAYDPYPSDRAKEIAEFVEQDELLAQSDIVSVHMPYFPGTNDQCINAEFISKMKSDAILVNTSRGELQDNCAILDAIKNNKIFGFATDVMPNEGSLFFKEFSAYNPIQDSVVNELISLYPRVLITPHVGSNTDEALKNMIETSYDNFNAVLTTGTCTNEL